MCSGFIGFMELYNQRYAERRTVWDPLPQELIPAGNRSKVSQLTSHQLWHAPSNFKLA